MHKISTAAKAFGQLSEARLTRPLESLANTARNGNRLILAGTRYPSRMLQLLCLRNADK